MMTRRRVAFLTVLVLCEALLASCAAPTALPTPTATVLAKPSPTVTAVSSTLTAVPTTVPPPSSGATTNSNQSAASDPASIVISNVRDSSFVVSWLTVEKRSGQVQLVRGAIYDDDRGANFADQTHYVTVTGLNANDTYSFDLVSGGKTFDHAGAHWTVGTGSPLPAFPPDLISGKLKATDKSKTTDAIVFIAIDRQAQIPGIGVSAPLSALVTAKDGGIFQVNLREARAMGDPTRYYGYSAEGDFRTLVMIAAMGAGGTGLAQVDARDKRLRTSDLDQLLVIELSPDK